MGEFEDFFKMIAEGKKDYKEKDVVGKSLAKARAHIKEDMSSMFAQFAQLKPKTVVYDEPEDDIWEDEIEEEIEEIVEEVAPIVKRKKIPKSVEKFTEVLSKTVHAPVIVEAAPVDQNYKALLDRFKQLEKWVGKISNAGPGSGEVNLRYLDDIDRSSITNGYVLSYNAAAKKFVFIEPPTGGGGDFTPYALRADFFSDTVTYRGEAVPGSLDSDPVWKIAEITMISTEEVSKKWANGSAAANFVWDDHLTLSYS